MIMGFIRPFNKVIGLKTFLSKIPYKSFILTIKVYVVSGQCQQKFDQTKEKPKLFFHLPVVHKTKETVSRNPVLFSLE